MGNSGWLGGGVWLLCAFTALGCEHTHEYPPHDHADPATEEQVEMLNAKVKDLSQELADERKTSAKWKAELQKANEQLETLRKDPTSPAALPQEPQPQPQPQPRRRRRRAALPKTGF